MSFYISGIRFQIKLSFLRAIIIKKRETLHFTLFFGATRDENF